MAKQIHEGSEQYQHIKTCVRFIMTYRVVTRSEVIKTKQIMKTTEMKTLRMITEKTLHDIIRDIKTREDCGGTDVER